MIPQVSVCIPAYEQPFLIERAINSVFSQAFENFEIIVTDDSESDSVQNIIKNWINDKRLKYFKNVNKLGSPENWNECLRHCTAPLIKFLHHDDWFSSPDSLGEFVSAMQKNPNINFAFSSSYGCTYDGKKIFLHSPSKSKVYNFRKKPWTLQYGNIVGAPSATIFRSYPNLFDKKLKWLVDVDSYLELLNTGKSFVYINEPLLCISTDGDYQVTQSVSNNVILRCWEQLYVYTKWKPPLFARLSGFIFLLYLIHQLKKDDFDKLSKRRKIEKRTIEEKITFDIMKLKNDIYSKIKKISNLINIFRSVLNQRPRLSYSQCGEDMIIDHLLMWLQKNTDITYLDIGANHPTWLSNTYHLYKKGCNGVLIEPDIDLCRKLIRRRSRDTVLNLAVGEYGEEILPMYVMSSRTLNTLDKEQAFALVESGSEKIEEIRSVKKTGINEILNEYFPIKPPTLVSLDIEGMDLLILKAWNFDICRPIIFCIETLTYTHNNTEEKLKNIIEYMKQKDYMVYADTFVNTIFVNKKSWDDRK